MRRKIAWDVEVTFDPTYSHRPEQSFVARAYRHGSRTMAWMVETGATHGAVVEAITRRIAAVTETDAPKTLITYHVASDGTIL